MTVYEIILHILACAGAFSVGRVVAIAAMGIYEKRQQRDGTITMLREQVLNLAKENQELKEKTRWN